MARTEGAPLMVSTSLADRLARETRESDLYETLADGRLRCLACGHRCPLPDGAVGVCKVRVNERGRLRVPYGYVGAVQCDPIEKKPFFHVADSIRRLHAMEFWVEIVTLLIPGVNDSPDEIARLTAFIADVSPDIRWHVTAFHADYKMRETPGTTADMLLAAAATARSAGLRYVYAGNLPGRVGTLEDTTCLSCGHTLVARRGFEVRAYHITADSRCSRCATLVPGRWTSPFVKGARQGRRLLRVLR